ncbi:hypothetical protein LLG88_13665 [bacterium]|nr:hypothetical protein [bacterium]
MGIDPNIPLAARAPQAPNVLQKLGDVMALKDRQLETQARVQAAGDDAALREAMAQHPDDPEAVSNTLQQSGHGAAALRFESAIAAQRKTHLDTLKAENDVYRQQLEQGLQVVQGVKDQGTLTAAKGYLQKYEPRLAAMLPDVWDEPDASGQSKARQAVDFLRGIGMKASEYTTWQNEMLTHLEKRPKTEQDWLALSGQIMSGAKTPELWSTYRGILRAQGAPQTVLALVPEQYDEKAPDRMATLAMTPEERRRLADTAESRAEQKRHNLELERQSQERNDRLGGQAGLSEAQKGAALRFRDARIDKLKAAYKWDGDSRKWVGKGEEIDDDEFQGRLLEIENSYRAQTNQETVGSLAEAGWKVKGVNTPAWEPPSQNAGAKPTASMPAAANTSTTTASPQKARLEQQIRALADQVKGERDPAKQAALKVQGQQLLAQYDALR